MIVRCEYCQKDIDLDWELEHFFTEGDNNWNPEVPKCIVEQENKERRIKLINELTTTGIFEENEIPDTTQLIFDDLDSIKKRVESLEVMAEIHIAHINNIIKREGTHIQKLSLLRQEFEDYKRESKK